jgi:hypothetical protein
LEPCDIGSRRCTRCASAFDAAHLERRRDGVAEAGAEQADEVAMRVADLRGEAAHRDEVGLAAGRLQDGGQPLVERLGPVAADVALVGEEVLDDVPVAERAEHAVRAIGRVDGVAGVALEVEEARQADVALARRALRGEPG